MGYRLLADAVVVLHLAFIAFVLAGGFLVLARPRLAWVHLPAVAWAAYAECTSTLCPLTPLENALRARAGQAGYEGGFIEHYLIPLIYPPGLTPGTQLVLGAIVVAVNVGVYALAWRRWRNERASRIHLKNVASSPERAKARSESRDST
jgi:Protein of Unknown function (DUF2784)